MAAELITPLDERTGIPLPILPEAFLSPNNPNTNWHHAWHAESAPELQGLAGKALRHSRVQLVRATDHNHGDKTRGKLVYHDFYVGPSLPTDELEIFKLCIIAAAGYIPDKAINLHTGGEPSVVHMTDQQVDWLRRSPKPRPLGKIEIRRLRNRAIREYELLETPALSQEDFIAMQRQTRQEKERRQADYGRQHMRYQYVPIRNFFSDLLMRQDISDVDQSEQLIAEFLLTPHEERKMRLGRWLLAKAAERSAENVRDPYRTLRREGSLHPLMPNDPATLVLFKLGDRQQRSELVVRYEATLRSKLGLQPAA